MVASEPDENVYSTPLVVSVPAIAQLSPCRLPATLWCVTKISLKIIEINFIAILGMDILVTSQSVTVYTGEIVLMQAQTLQGVV